MTGSSVRLSSFLRSWQSLPLVDIYVTSDSYCPAEYPEDVVYEVWLGTRGFCECLQRDDNRDYYLNTKCKKGKNEPHKSIFCNNVGGLAPIVQNRIQGVRYCGRRGSTSLEESVRPTRVANEEASNGRKYTCPEGY